MWPFRRHRKTPCDLIVPKIDEAIELQSKLATARIDHRNTYKSFRQTVENHRRLAEEALSAFDRGNNV